MNGISLRRPFVGDYPVSFPFGREPTAPAIAEKFRLWGIIGHHGVDIALPEGTPVLAAASGKVIQAGENADWGISVTLEHPWGTSIYAHLKEALVVIGQEVKQGAVIGYSGQTGAAFGPHLHFGIKPLNANVGNGYLGFIDPLPYLEAASPVEEIVPAPTKQEPTITEVQPEQPAPTPPAVSEPPREPPSSSTLREIPVEQLIDEVIKKRLNNLRAKANEARRLRREEKLAAIVKLAEAGPLTNRLIREKLRLSRPSAALYLRSLVSQGKLTRNRQGRGTLYFRVRPMS